VTNLSNRRSVIVTINDRGPSGKRKDIDLTKKAFMEITDNKNHGEIKVKIDISK
jgi:rare lipoprotein A